MKRFIPAALITLLVAASCPPAVAAPPTVPPPPEIVSPGEIEQFPGMESVEIRWNAAPGATFYHLILARDRSFRKIVFENNMIPSTIFLDEHLNYGTYFLKIRSSSPTGANGPFSETRTFVLTPPLPETLLGHTGKE